jgi:N utilization substance protein A
MRVTLSDEARRYITLFEDETEVQPRDCLISDERLVFLIPAGEMGQAIGPGGRRVKRVESATNRTVGLVEDADRAEDLVANALAPAAVYNVTISENEDTVAYAEVAQEDRGVAIGTDGRNIEAARALARRHFGVDDVELA